MLLETKLDIILKTETIGHHHGQIDCTINAYLGSDKVGSLDYSVYHNKPSIKMINVKLKRSGIGTQMIRELQKEYPTEQIDFGMLTADGMKLYKTLVFKTVKNTNLYDREVLERHTEIINKKRSILSKLESAGVYKNGEIDWDAAYKKDLSDLGNDLSDVEHELEEVQHEMIIHKISDTVKIVV